MDINFLVVAFLVTFVSSYFGSLIGGGGLLVTQFLLAFGLPVPIALGSRRFSTIGGNISGFIQFHRWKKIDYKLSIYLILYSVIGAIAGFIVVDKINSALLKNIIGVTIIVLLIVIFFEDHKKIQLLKGVLYRWRSVLGPSLMFAASVLSVVIGGAGATLASYALIIVYGQTILESSGTRKLPLGIGNLIAVALFAYKGYIDYLLSTVMLVAHFIGGWFGSKFYLKKGEDKVRIFFYATVLILAIKILFF